MRVFRIREKLGSSLWFVPLLCVLGGVVLSFVTIALDRWSGGSAVPRSLSGDPDAALSILTTVAASMVTLTGLVLTVTMVVVQLAMGQFSPRVLRTILRDRPSQFAIGVFVATFAHAMLVMREVKAASGQDEGYVPGLAIVVAFVLIIISIMVLVSYVNHIGQSLRVASLIQSVGDETRERLDELYPSDRDDGRAPVATPEGEPDRTIDAPEAGVLYRIDHAELVQKARQAGVVLKLLRRIGDFVPEGASLFAVYGKGRFDEDDLVSSVAIGKERTMHQDLAFGFRMLVDVAERSLSSAMGDPTTAIQAIDRLHDNLRQLACRPFPPEQHFDEGGELRLITPTIPWETYVQLAFDEIRHYGKHSLQVASRLKAMLEDLVDVAPLERRPPLERQLRLVEAMAKRAFEDEEDVEAALRPDHQGIGSAAPREPQQV